MAKRYGDYEQGCQTQDGRGPWANQEDWYPLDTQLRAIGFAIYSRPNRGFPVWRLKRQLDGIWDVGLYPEPEALQILAEFSRIVREQLEAAKRAA